MRARNVAAVLMAVLLAVMMCGCGHKDIPEGMSEEAYDFGTQMVEIANDYLDGSISANAAEVRMDRASESFRCTDGCEADARVDSMAYFVQDSLSSSTEEHAKANMRTYRDALEHVLETGEYPSDLNGFEEPAS